MEKVVIMVGFLLYYQRNPVLVAVESYCVWEVLPLFVAFNNLAHLYYNSYTTAEVPTTTVDPA